MIPGIRKGFMWDTAILTVCVKRYLFPFGYGLSYTNFQVRFKSLMLDKMTAEISAEVENTGDFCGKEVVQLYVSVPEEEAGSALSGSCCMEEKQKN